MKKTKGGSGERKGMKGIRKWLGEKKGGESATSPAQKFDFNDLESDEELAQRYGHNMVEIQHRGEDDRVRSGLLIFGGCNSKGDYLDEVWAFIPSSSSFLRIAVSEKPMEGDKEKGKGGLGDSLPRSFATMVQYNNKEVYLFGGKNKFFLNDLWRLEVETLEWQKLEHSSSGDESRPGRRMGHSAVVYRDSMWVFGGYSDSGFACNDLWEYQFDSRMWRRIRYKGEVPCRYNHGAAVVGDYMYIFGGKGDSAAVEPHLFQYSFVEDVWQQVQAPPGPNARWGPAFGYCTVADGLMVHGGLSGGTMLKDCWFFSFGSNRWEKVNQESKHLSKGIAYHTLVFRHEDGFIFGGMTNEGLSNNMTEIWSHIGRISLQQLPVEIGLLIFATLSPADLSRAMCVCRHWRDLAMDDSLWKPFYLSLPTSDQSLTSGFRQKVVEEEGKGFVFWQQMKSLRNRTLLPVLRPKYTNPKPLTFTYLKIVLVGDGAVGKTCLHFTWGSNSFPGEYIPTVFENPSTQMVVDGKSIHVTVWDTAGQEDYDRLRPLSYPETDAFMLCFSIASRTSFNNITSKWVPEIMGKGKYNYGTPPPDLPFILVGLKTDLYEDEKLRNEKPECFVYEKEARELAARIGALGYYPVSALAGVGVQEVFQEACRAAMYENEVTHQRKKERCMIQ